MSRVDKTIANAYYEFLIDDETLLPKRIRVTVLTGRKGGTEKEGKKIVGGEHVVFQFSYALKKFGKVERPEIPAPAKKLLAKAK